MEERGRIGSRFLFFVCKAPPGFLPGGAFSFQAEPERRGCVQREGEDKVWLGKSAGLFGFKSVFAQAADRADPILRHILPSRAGSYTVIWVACGGVIDIAAGADIFTHGFAVSFLLAEVTLQQALERLAVAGLVMILLQKPRYIVRTASSISYILCFSKTFPTIFPPKIFLWEIVYPALFLAVFC